MANFFYSIDLGLRTLLYNKFGSNLGINTQSSSTSENINKGVILFPKDVAQRIIAEKRGEYFLEFINFWRTSTEFSWERNRTPAARRGLLVPTSNDGVKAVKAVPVDLSYGIWFWSKSRNKVQDCIETYMFWQHTYPKMEITYDDLYTLEFDVHFSPVTDESPIDQMFSKGQYTIYHGTISVDGWIFSDTNEIAKIEKIRITYYDKDDLETYTEIYVEDENQDTEMEAALRMLRTNLYGIEEIDLENNTVSVVGNRTSSFGSGVKFRIENSTDNDEMYTVVSSVYSDGNTVITVQEDLVSDTADGNIHLIKN